MFSGLSNNTTRRGLLDRAIGYTLTFAWTRRLLGQQQPVSRSSVQTRRNANGEITEASYQQGDTKVQMVVTRKGGSGRYTIQITFLENGEKLLQCETELTKKEQSLGIVTAVAEGREFSYRITVDGSGVPVSAGAPSSGKATVIVEDRNGKHTGSFDLETWRPSDNLRELPKASLPERIDVKIAPFEGELITLIVQPFKREGTASPNSEIPKPPASFWRRSGCSMTCWGATTIAAGVGCFLSRGRMCTLIQGGTSAAAAFCDKQCPPA
jgi:hypothetical protein